jgi:hypothetical protein
MIILALGLVSEVDECAFVLLVVVVASLLGLSALVLEVDVKVEPDDSFGTWVDVIDDFLDGIGTVGPPPDVIESFLFGITRFSFSSSMWLSLFDFEFKL